MSVITLNIEKTLSIYKKLDSSDGFYKSMGSEHLFLFEYINNDKTLLNLSKDENICQVLAKNCRTTAVYFKDENNRLLEMELSIPFSLVNEQYVAGFTFFGSHYLRKNNVVLTFDDSFVLNLVQSMVELMGMYSMFSGPFKDNGGICGKTDDGKNIIIDSVKINSFIQCT